MWQTEKIFKSKIKQRLDFLLDHSTNIDDFLKKAEALDLYVDFSGKWSTYRLLDQPQIKNTRGRNLSKQNPNYYNIEVIKERLNDNDAIFSIDEVVNLYQEKSE